MNTSPSLTQDRQDRVEATRLEKLRDQLSEDMQAMQQREASLREYEQRLRLLVEHAHDNRPVPNASQFIVTTGPDRSSLDSEWEKYNRAHALLEAARRSLSDDRMVLKERTEQLAIREEEVSRREAWVKVRELELATAQMPPPAAPPKASRAPFQRFFSRSKAK